MLDKTMDELNKMASSQPGTYKPEAVEAANSEIQRRNAAEPFNPLCEATETPQDEIKFKTLIVVSDIIGILAWVFLGMGVVSAFVSPFVSYQGSRFALGLNLMLYGGFGCLFLLALSGCIKVLIAIEENTRLSAKNSSR